MPEPLCATSVCSTMARPGHRGQGRLIVGEAESVPVDRDEMLLIEEWRLRPDGTAIAPGVDPKDAVPLYTINGRDFIRAFSISQ